MNKFILAENVLEEEIRDLLQNGMPEGLYLNFQSLDEMFRLDLGMVAIYTGVPNYGKSEFIDFVNVRLNRLYGLKTLYFSPENMPVKLHLSKLISKITHKKFADLNIEEINGAMEIIKNNFFFINTENSMSIDDILTTAEYAIANLGVKVLVIDPYNRIEWQRPNNLSETEYVGVVMDKLSRFAKKHNILVQLVVHPKKMQTVNGEIQMPNLYDLNGSANFANMADYVIIVHRDFINNYTTIKVDKVKFKNYGRIGETYIRYNYSDGNYEEIELDGIDNEKFKTIKNIADKILQKREEIKAKELKNKNVLDVDISYFNNCFEMEGKTINLYNYLTDPDNEYYNANWFKVEEIRKAESKEDIRELKNKSNLPCVTISCVTGKDKTEIKSVNNLIAIDIDKQDNNREMSDIFNQLKMLNYIAYAGKSVSGKGLYCIIPILDAKSIKDYFNAIKKEFEEMGIIVDKNCSNVNRLRFYSFDENYYINPNAEIYTKKIDRQINITKTFEGIKGKNKAENTIIKIINILQKNKDEIKQNYKLDITYDYNNWFRIGAAIANTFGENGYKYFNAISELSVKYNKYECRYKYTELLCNPASEIQFGTLVKIFTDNYKFE